MIQNLFLLSNGDYIKIYLVIEGDFFMDKILTLPQKQQEYIENYMPNNDMLFKLADFFNIFSDVTRIKILTALSISDMCVNDLSVVLNLNQTTVSHQLKFLRQCGAVYTARCGKLIYYKISTPVINDVMMGGVEYLMAK